MKCLGDCRELLSAPQLIRISVLAFASVASFYLARNWSNGYPQLIFYSSANAGTARQSLPGSPSISISPNANTTFDISALISDPSTDASPTLDAAPKAIPSPPPPPPPPPPAAERFGIVDDTGAMREDFDVGTDDPDLAETWNDGEAANVTKNESKEGEGRARVKVNKFRPCPGSMMEYIPCMDNEEEIKQLRSTERGERFERHCPAEGKGLNCLVPVPRNYKTPIPWPRSRDEVWFSNVPHTRLVEDKGGQNWIFRDKDKFKFPGGGTQFIHGASQYLDQISKMVPDIAFGIHTRVALDVGCGVASFGAFLQSRNVITLSIAPKDVHENQIQFALERGVPAMVATFATRRLSYPSQLMAPSGEDGILLLEVKLVNRILRAGGYFAWAAQPVYKHEESQQEAWKEMEDLTTRICWELVKEGYIAIWRKPLNNTCYINRDSGAQPPLCDAEDDSNSVWYDNLKACISPLPENEYAGNLTSWPARLHEPPQRLQGVEMDAYLSKGEFFKSESRYWDDIIDGYVRAFHWNKLNLRKIMDMRAGFGGFAATLIDQQIDSWVMNVVPISGPNTLPAIYVRGLIGVAHDWCKISIILLEMDHILRPGGGAYIRDSRSVIDEV